MTTATATTLAAASVFILTLPVGCDNRSDSIFNLEQTDQKAVVAFPGIAETKAIAEEAYIYGLPIVMNYAVMNEFCVDKSSGQYKGPFNKITNVTASDIDVEHDYLFECLKTTEDLKDHSVEKGFHKQLEGRNGGGDPWRTDGSLVVGVIAE